MQPGAPKNAILSRLQNAVAMPVAHPEPVEQVDRSKTDNDEGNTVLATSRKAVETLNAEFYTRFQYPLAPMALDTFEDPQFEITMLNQAIGEWDCKAVPPEPDVWVAGCGTNQAAITALHFPSARVIGSDISPGSLEACSKTAAQVGISNLTLKRESISDAGYSDRFDHIKCTGVIHHTADPEATLDCLAKALKPSGVLELMVYNKFHRTLVSAFQKAVQMLEGSHDKPDFDLELEIARKLLAAGAIQRSRHEADEMLDRNDSHLADAVIQPVEYGYTVESLRAMADRCALELITPCVNQFDQSAGTWNWEMRFDDVDLRSRYEDLPDARRWQVTNLLRLEASPLLWFYLQRKDSGRTKPTEQERCETFLDRRFQPAQTKRQIYVKRGDHYEAAHSRQPHPLSHPDELCRTVLESINESPKSMRETFVSIGADQSFFNVNTLRQMLTTPAFPYVQAVH